MSQRFDTLKKEDPILSHDLIDVFKTNLDQVMKNLSINDFQVLVNMIPDSADQNHQHLRKQFIGLISSGNGPN